jgi:endonuclease YncB( thermonuclease family)
MTKCPWAWLPALALMLYALASVASATELHGRVIAVADGDTLTMLVGQRQHRIRLDGIDAPERTQPYSNLSRQSLSELAHHRRATAQCHKTDKYGRPVCKVLISGVDVNLEQIRRGLAWHFKHYESEQAPKDRASYAEAEQDARASRRGLWASTQPLVPPWEFRAEKRGVAP